MSSPCLLNHIIAPLAKHPDQTASRNEDWPCQTPAPRRGLEHKPLGHEMSPCDSIGAYCELVELRIGYVIGSVETDDGRDNSPSTKDP